MNLKAGDLAPRDGLYALKGEPFTITLKAGQSLPVRIAPKSESGELVTEKIAHLGDLTRENPEFESHELRDGEVVPRDGVYWNAHTSSEHALKRGGKFPDGPGEGDYTWCRELSAEQAAQIESTPNPSTGKLPETGIRPTGVPDPNEGHPPS